MQYSEISSKFLHNSISYEHFFNEILQIGQNLSFKNYSRYLYWSWIHANRTLWFKMPRPFLTSFPQLKCNFKSWDFTSNLSTYTIYHFELELSWVFYWLLMVWPDPSLFHVNFWYLFQNLIKFTRAGGGDCTQLMEAVSMLSDICREVESIMLLDNMQGWENPEPSNSVISHVS